MSTDAISNPALLVLPRLRVQNANAISSPMTWGFPSITAFTGFMTALERRLGPKAGIAFFGIGVICHGVEPQVTRDGYTRAFHLTRNPVLQDGSTGGIVEEGRVHLDITLVLDVTLSGNLLGEAERTKLAAHIGELIAGMRIAGGSVMPALAPGLRRASRAQLVLVSDNLDKRREDFRRLSRRWLPGYALVSRDDLLATRLDELRKTASAATLLDAWLDLSRLNYHATIHKTVDDITGEQTQRVDWTSETRSGWTVPIPVGFASLTSVYPAGTVAGARDPSTPFCFVESVYSIGQWISPHRLDDVKSLLWEPTYSPSTGLYRCVNAFRPPALPLSHID